jgi:hypothetical protein
MRTTRSDQRCGPWLASPPAPPGRNVLGINPGAHARILEMLSEVVRRHPERTSALDGSLDALLVEGRAALQRGAEREGGPQ